MNDDNESLRMYIMHEGVSRKRLPGDALAIPAAAPHWRPSWRSTSAALPPASTGQFCWRLAVLSWPLVLCLGQPPLNCIKNITFLFPSGSLHDRPCFFVYQNNAKSYQHTFSTFFPKMLLRSRDQMILLGQRSGLLHSASAFSNRMQDR